MNFCLTGDVIHSDANDDVLDFGKFRLNHTWGGMGSILHFVYVFPQKNL